MDIVSHGLWGGIAFGRKNKKEYAKALFFGVAPDLFSFGIFFVASVLGIASRPDFSAGPPDPSSIPSYVHTLYDITHSLVVFAIAFGLVWLIRKKPFIPMLAWGLHIMIDIPTHSFDFFPTPFLWPLSDLGVDGIPWGREIIWYPNIALLVALHLWLLVSRIKKRKNNSLSPDTAASENAD